MKKAVVVLLCLAVALAAGGPVGAAGVKDLDGDGKIGLEEANFALQVASGLYRVPDPTCQLVGRGDWAAGSGYLDCDVVRHSDRLFICVRAHAAGENRIPPDVAADLWEELVPRGFGCWDSDRDHVCDRDEDSNDDGKCNAYDCQDDLSVGELRTALCDLYRKTRTPTPDFCPALLVFVTSRTYPGNFGGTAAGDRICQEMATAAGLKGRYRAWLSDSERMPAGGWPRPEMNYRLVDGTFVANDWEGLLRGELDHPISLDPRGRRVRDAVWTGTYDNGQQSRQDCDGWRSADPKQTGSQGQSASTRDWSHSTVIDCSGYGCLYCFEQPPQWE